MDAGRLGISAERDKLNSREHVLKSTSMDGENGRQGRSI
jgi:hypothetical protein